MYKITSSKTVCVVQLRFVQIRIRRISQTQRTLSGQFDVNLCDEERVGL